jgi:hypothetical protein
LLFIILLLKLSCIHCHRLAQGSFIRPMSMKVKDKDKKAGRNEELPRPQTSEVSEGNEVFVEPTVKVEGNQYKPNLVV